MSKQWLPPLSWLQERGVEAQQWIKMDRKERAAFIARERKKQRRFGKNRRIRRMGLR